MKYFLTFFILAQVFGRGTEGTLENPIIAGIKHPKGLSLDLAIFSTPEERLKGLTGIKSEDFPPNKGGLFLSKMAKNTQIAAKNTYFALDVLFLDGNLRVLDIFRNLAAHPGLKEPPPFPKTKMYFGKFILCIKSLSPFSKVVKVGDKLIWNAPKKLEYY